MLYENPLAEDALADAVTELAVTGQERHADGATQRGDTLVECWLVMELCNMGTLQVGTTGCAMATFQAPNPRCWGWTDRLSYTERAGEGLCSGCSTMQPKCIQQCSADAPD